MRLLSVLLLFATSVCIAISEPAFVDLTADIEITGWGNSAYDDPPMFRSPTVWKIRCVVGTNAWLISASNQVTSAEKWQYTGSNLVRQFGDPARPSNLSTANFNGDPDSVQNAELFSPAVRIPWLAFCSGPFLSRPGKQVPLPSLTWKWWLYSDYISPPVGFQSKVVRFDDDFGLPISVDVLSKAGRSIFEYRTLQGPIASPISTNIGGWQFPVEFRAIQYAPMRKATNRWSADMIIHGKVTSIKVGSEPKL